ncbi:ABC transporter permease [Actinocorallia sp. A-T 12471]|uniref:ABC transporter permease n=1 Tax=Actinocorallia sp. A-T 12471 TaxID=3089813 RepID=UPI0029CE36F6|nr:FtsX-like permease family protein [Actinocorallia sp. A-T 12471]MDX6744286.1 FtsX-like permease family protein [Actinocorallia sp. A-T 12471]
MTRVTLRNLAAHKLRLVLTALSVILGVAFVSGTLIFTDTANKSFDNLFDDLFEHTTVAVRAEPSVGGQDEAVRTGVPIAENLKDEIAKVPGVVEARGEVNGFAALIDSSGDLVGGGGPPQMGLAWNGDPSTPLTKGAPPTKAGEVVLGEKTAERVKADVGDKVRVAVQGGQEEAVVTGLAGGDDLGVTFVFFDTATAQKLLLEPGQYSLISVKGQDGITQTEMRDRIAPLLPAGLEAVTADQLADESRSEVDTLLGFLRNFLLAFAIVSIVVGSFNIVNTFTMLIGQRTRELALLRAIGASRRQITRAVLGEAVIVGVVGSTLGILVGAGIAALLKSVFGTQGLDLGSGLSLTPAAIGWSYAVGILVTCAAAYFPARRAAKIPPVAAMRDDVSLPQRGLRVRAVIGTVLAALGAGSLAAGLAGTGGTEETLALIGVGVLLVWLAASVLAAVIGKPVIRVLAGWYPKVFGVSGRLARQNPQRNPRRTAVTAVALMIGLSLVTTVNVLASSIKASLSDVVDSQFGADYIVQTMSPAGLEPGAVKAVRDASGVTSVVEIGQGTFTLDGKDAFYVSGEPQGMLGVLNRDLVSGTAQTGRDGILLSETKAKDDGLSPGDTLTAAFPDGKTETLRVAGVYQDSQFIGSYLLGPEAWRAHTPKALPVLLAIDTTTTGAAVHDALDAAVDPFPGATVLDQADLKEETMAQLDGILIFFTLMLALSVIIAIFGVVNTITLSVTERTREIGLLRAVGLSRRQTRRMIRLESVVIAVFGGFLGIGLGLVFGIALQRSGGEEMAILSIPYVFLGVCALFSALVGILASLWPAWRAGRMDVLKAIATQ